MANKSSTPFLVFEAINAGGKTTQFNLLLKRLKKNGYHVYSYHFHQRDFPTGQLIEHKFLHQPKVSPPLGGGEGGGARNSAKTYFFSRREQALLYIQDFFSRAHDIAGFLNGPSGKKILVSDRFYTSTLAYQTIGLSGRRRQSMVDWIKWLCEQGEPQLPRPDQVILLDTPTAIAAKHLTGTNQDYFENTKRLTLLRRSYLRLAREEKWTVINSVNDRGEQRSIEDIHAEIWSKVTKLL